MYLNKLFIFKKLQQSNTHLGPSLRGKNSKWSRFSAQRAQSYIFGFRAKQPIIDLDKTVISLRRACNVIQLIIRSNGHLLFVNTNPKYNKIIQQTAKYTNQSYINHKWIGGFLTNWNHMRNVQQQFHAATRFSKSSLVGLAYGKKVEPVMAIISENARKRPVYGDSITKLTTRFPSLPPTGPFTGGLRSRTGFEHPLARASNLKAGTINAPDLTIPNSCTYPRKGRRHSLIVNNPRYKKMQKCFEGALASEATESGPDCVIIFNASQNSNAIYEAHLNQIPIISIVDSNVPNELYNLITYPIPANYDSVQFIYLFCNCIFKIILAR
jgi:ribosomal protein S2